MPLPSSTRTTDCPVPGPRRRGPHSRERRRKTRARPRRGRPRSWRRVVGQVRRRSREGGAPLCQCPRALARRTVGVDNAEVGATRWRVPSRPPPYRSAVRAIVGNVPHHRVADGGLCCARSRIPALGSDVVAELRPDHGLAARAIPAVRRNQPNYASLRPRQHRRISFGREEVQVGGAGSDVVPGVLIVGGRHGDPVPIREERIGIAAVQPACGRAEIPAQIVVEKSPIGGHHDSPRAIVRDLVVGGIREPAGIVERRGEPEICWPFASEPY